MTIMDTLFWLGISALSCAIGLYFSRKIIALRREAEQREREEQALDDLEKAMGRRELDKARPEVRALLATRGGLLPIEAKDEAEAWLTEIDERGVPELRAEELAVLSAARALAADLTKAHPGEPFAPKLSEAEKGLVAAVHATDRRWESYDPGPRHRAKPPATRLPSAGGPS